jgi:pyroglutamyl-peptidase
VPLPRLLVTGFGRFLDHPENPTEGLVRRIRAEGLPGWETTAEVLPVVYGRSAERLAALLDGVRPDAAICFGLSGRAEGIVIEQVALNLDDAPSPDVEGAVRVGRPIDPDAPVAFRTGLPVARMLAALGEAGIPAGTSRDAGGYVCNHVFFALRRHAPDLPSGFVHVPPAPEHAAAEGRTGLDADTLLRAARVLAATLLPDRPRG